MTSKQVGFSAPGRSAFTPTTTSAVSKKDYCIATYLFLLETSTTASFIQDNFLEVALEIRLKSHDWFGMDIAS